MGRSFEALRNPHICDFRSHLPLDINRGIVYIDSIIYKHWTDGMTLYYNKFLRMSREIYPMSALVPAENSELSLCCYDRSIFQDNPQQISRGHFLNPNTYLKGIPRWQSQLLMECPLVP